MENVYFYFFKDSDQGPSILDAFKISHLISTELSSGPIYSPPKKASLQHDIHPSIHSPSS